MTQPCAWCPSPAKRRESSAPAKPLGARASRGPPARVGVTTRQHELLAALEGAAWRPDGPVVAWFYDPPWTLPPFRRNEVAVPVAADGR